MDVQDHQPNTPIALVIRCLSWFQAFAVLDNLDQLNPKTIDHFMVPSPNTTRLRTWIGKGPISHDIGTSAFFYSDNGEETYPVFNFPSRSPKGAGVFVSKVNRKLIAHENTALFFLEVATCVPTDPKIFEQVQTQRLEESTEQFIRDSVNAANDILQVIVGTYALYQYPLIWQFLGERHQWSLVNVETHQVTQSYENPRADNFVPFQLNVSSKIASGHLVDGVHSTFSELVKKGPSLPFILLKDSMWHSDLRTRFLLQFWILEHFAEKYSIEGAGTPELKEFINQLEIFVGEKCPAYLDYFRARKGDLIRRPLTEKVKTCFHILKIQYNDAIFKKAKKVRDSLSHGSQVELQNLEEAELYIREIVRHMIRRDLEYAGIFLDGNIRKPEDFEELVPGFVRARQDMKEASFGPL